MGAGGNNCPLVDQYHLPVSEQTGTGDRVVYVCERHARDDTRNNIQVAVGQYYLTTTLKCDAILNQLNLGCASGRLERNNACIVDDAAERQQGAVANRQTAGVLRDGRNIKQEIVCC